MRRIDSDETIIAGAMLMKSIMKSFKYGTFLPKMFLDAFVKTLANVKSRAYLIIEKQRIKRIYKLLAKKL